MVKLTTLLFATVALLASTNAQVSLAPTFFNETEINPTINSAEDIVDSELLPPSHQLVRRAPVAKPKLTKEQKTILDAHNKVRALHGAPPLVWNTKAEKHGQNWLKRCAFEHSQSREFGENLAMGYGSFKQVVNGWYSEVSNYNYNRPGFGMKTGHFTQVVWKSTKSVGCAKRTCNGRPLYICNYYGPGNYANQYRENVLPRKK